MRATLASRRTSTSTCSWDKVGRWGPRRIPLSPRRLSFPRADRAVHGVAYNGLRRRAGRATRPRRAAWARRPSGLPGLGRVAVAAPKELPHAAVAAGVGYGFTEAQNVPASRVRRSSSPARQPRADGAAASLPLGRSRARRTLRNASGRRARLELEHRRWSLASSCARTRAVGKSFALGAQLGLWVPGAEAPSLRFDATTLDATPPRHVRPARLRFHARAQRRLPTSISQRPRCSTRAIALRIRAGDRLALRLSDSDAVLLGLGAEQASRRAARPRRRASSCSAS